MSQLLTDEEIRTWFGAATEGSLIGFARAIERGVLAKLGAQEPIGEIRTFPGTTFLKAHFSKGCCPPAGTKLYAAPPIPAGMALDAARYQWLQESGSHWILVDNETERLLQYPSNYDWPNTLQSAIVAAMLAAAGVKP
jgi:hypothetical protein